MKYSSIVWTHDNKGFFYQVRFNDLSSSPTLIYSVRGIPTAQRMVLRVRIRWNWRSRGTRTLRSFTTESTPTRVCLSSYTSYALLDQWSDAAEDILVIENSNQPEWTWGPSISREDGRWLKLYIYRDCSRVCFTVLLILRRSKLEIEKYALAGRPWEGTNRLKLQLD